jgi:hemerythrin-like domain-containing protein
METVEPWRREHEEIGRLLLLLEREVDAFHRAEQPDYEAMHEVVSSLVSYTDRLHHPVQAAAFGRMVRRDPGLQIVVNRLGQEHRVIAASGAELLERLREVAADALMPRGVVEAAAATYLVYFRHHIAVERRELLPRAARLLDADDWRRIRAAVPDMAGHPPGDAVGHLRLVGRRAGGGAGGGVEGGAGRAQ